MPEMFCFQCEQTAKGTGCTIAGVCGKNAATAKSMDELTCALIALARAAHDGLRTEKSDKLIMKGLFITLTNVDFDIDRIEKMKAEVEAEKNRTNASEPVMDAFELFHGDTDIVSLRSTLLFGLRGMAAYAYHALVLGKTSDEVTGWLYKGLSAIPENHTVDEWLGLVMELGQANLTSISAHRFRPFSPRMCWMC